MTPGPEQKLALHRAMRRIRQLQLAIEAVYHQDQMKTPVHLCVGQEAIAVGVCAHLSDQDYVSSNHRGHGHYLAKGGDLQALVSELFCRSTGCSQGRGGSMHLVDISVGHMGSSSIVGGGIPIAAGLAFAAQYLGQERVSVCFFGDGAADEGTLYESLNFAMLKRLPVVYVLEDNCFAVCSATQNRQCGDNIFLSAPPERLLTAKVDGNDLWAVHEAAGRAVARARAGQGPSLIACDTYRMRGHAGAGHDAHLGYRSLGEIEQWQGRDPLERLEAELLAEGLASAADLAAVTREADKEMALAFARAQDDPLPTAADLHRHLYQEP